MADLVWYRNVHSGSVHGFTLPFPRTNPGQLSDLEMQIATGKLVPCEAPAPEDVNTLSLPDDVVAKALAEEKRLGNARRREALLAELAELDADGGVRGEPGPELDPTSTGDFIRPLPRVVDERPAPIDPDEPVDLDSPRAAQPAGRVDQRAADPAPTAGGATRGRRTGR